ncbi:MAG: DUF4334 domain-containing protein [Pseudomonadales bacterium]|nr:DUF4334 domain-containing protein [Pseudomonadales bacterium]
MNIQVDINHIISEGTSTEQALAYFDELAPVTVDEMLGRWRGSGFPTDHPMDGLLENFNWWGKEFVSSEHVHPLVFSQGEDKQVTLDPLWMPLKYARNSRFARAAATRKAFALLAPLMKTQQSRARLRMLEYRGKVSATMVYDHKPINDVFRKLDEDTVIGVMDLKSMRRPFFFVLQRHS